MSSKWERHKERVFIISFDSRRRAMWKAGEKGFVPRKAASFEEARKMCLDQLPPLFELRSYGFDEPISGVLRWTLYSRKPSARYRGTEHYPCEDCGQTEHGVGPGWRCVCCGYPSK